MIYDTFANAVRGAAHTLIDITFPRTATIATITGFVSYLAHNKAVRLGPTYVHDKFIRPYVNLPNIPYEKIPYAGDYGGYLPDFLKQGVATSEKFLKDFVETTVSEAILAKVAPYIPLAASIAAGAATSTTLNLIHIGILKVKACWDWVFSKERAPENVPESPLHAPAAIPPPIKKQIEIPIYRPMSVHDMYFQAGK